MDPSTASYYRAILFIDGLSTEPLPPTLLQLHQWAVKRHLALGLGGTISKAIAFNVALTWMSTTREGWAFTRDNTPLGDLFGDPPGEEGPSELTAEEWDTLPAERKVLVTLADGSKKTGAFLGRRGNWIDVRIDGEDRHVRTSKVQLAGA